MSLAAGRVVLGRWQLLRELPGTADLWRWEARDTATGASVEVVAPTLMAALRPGAREQFLAAGRALPEGPAVVHRLAEGVEGSLPVAVLPPGRGPWPHDARLEDDEIAPLAAFLGAALLRGEPLPDGLRREDLSVDESGLPRLTPLGLVHGGAVHDPPRHRPPELRGGGAALPESALYGLGVLLFRAATGQDAVPGDRAAAWEAGLPRRARDLNPELSEATEDLLAGLLSADPGSRRAALEGLVGTPVALRAAPRPALPDGPRLAPRAASPIPTALTPPAAARPDLGIGRWSLAVRPASMSAPALRRAAALGQTWPSALTRAGGAGSWVPLADARSREEADQLARSWAALGVPVRLLAGEPPWAKTAGALGLIALGGILLLLGLLFLPLALLGVLALIGGAALGAMALELRRAQASALQGRSSLAQAMAAPDPAKEAERALASTRRELLLAALPDPERQDLLAELDEAEDGLAATQSPAKTAIEAVKRRVQAAQGQG